MISLIFGLFSCDSSGDFDFNEVYIRVNNQTGLNLDRVNIGSRLNKPSSLQHIEFGNEFNNVGTNEVTDYINTKGQFIGYTAVVIYSDEGQKAASRDLMEEQIKENDGFEDTFDNPLTDSTRTGFSLPKGNYTYRLFFAENENKNRVSVEIIED